MQLALLPHSLLDVTDVSSRRGNDPCHERILEPWSSLQANFISDEAVTRPKSSRATLIAISSEKSNDALYDTCETTNHSGGFDSGDKGMRHAVTAASLSWRTGASMSDECSASLHQVMKPERIV
jgi:hypothetical protein